MSGMILIDPDGLFYGDRVGRCSNAAQLHFPRLLLCSNSFGRFEVSYMRIIHRAYPRFNPRPSEAEIMGYIHEYSEHFLLFLYQALGQVWAQWDIKAELLPRYKTGPDRRSPFPPEPAYSKWRQEYRTLEKKGFPKLAGLDPCVGMQALDFEELPARLSDEPIQPSLQPTEPTAFPKVFTPSESCEKKCMPLPLPLPLPLETVSIPETVNTPSCPSPENGAGRVRKTTARAKHIPAEQADWFKRWWDIYWRRVAVGAARKAFQKIVTTPERFTDIMEATAAQKNEMMQRQPDKRPHGATWLNQERWSDEIIAAPSHQPKHLPKSRFR